VQKTLTELLKSLSLKITVHSPVKKIINGDFDKVCEELTFLKACYGTLTYTLEVEQ
jgi:hypothetical protein